MAGKSLVAKVIEDQYFAVLSSVANNRPYNNLVAFASTEDFKSLIFATGRATAKFARIKNNNHVSLLIDNRTNQPSDISQAIAIAALGIAIELLENEEHFKVLFIRRHPQLSNFIQEPGVALVMVKVSEYIIARFSHTEHLLPREL